MKIERDQILRRGSTGTHRMGMPRVVAATVLTGLVAAVAVAGCSSAAPTAAGATSSASSASASAVKTTAAAPAAPSGSCSLPDNQDLIVRDDDPGAQILAQEVGEANLGNCTTTLSSFAQTAGQAAGECSTIAWAKDNPGYDVNAVPAPPLKDVIQSAGPGC